MLEISTIFALLSAYGYLGVFFGIVLGGEILILLAGALASFGYLKLYWVIIFAIWGIVLHDIIWYLFGRYGREINFIKNLGKKLINKEKYQAIEDKFRQHSLKTILFIRFVYGFRAFVLLTAGFLRMNFWEFFVFNLIGSSIWTVIFALLGYFFGASFSILREIIKELYILIPIIFSFCIFTIFLIYFIKSKVSKKFNNNSAKVSKNL